MNEKVKDILEWILCIVTAISAAIAFRYFIGAPTVVQHPSMYPTLVANQRLILNRTHRMFGLELERGDIVTFIAPSKMYTSKYDVDQSNPVAVYDEEERGFFENFTYNVLDVNKLSYIKRVIGLPGEVVEIAGGKVYINGEELDEPYLTDDVETISNAYSYFTVPEGYVFLMGDNRTKSADCRDFGCIPLDKIEGKASFRFWPISEFGKIDD